MNLNKKAEILNTYLRNTYSMDSIEIINNGNTYNYLFKVQAENYNDPIVVNICIADDSYTPIRYTIASFSNQEFDEIKDSILNTINRFNYSDSSYICKCYAIEGDSNKTYIVIELPIYCDDTFTGELIFNRVDFGLSIINENSHIYVLKQFYYDIMNRKNKNGGNYE